MFDNLWFFVFSLLCLDMVRSSALVKTKHGMIEGLLIRTWSGRIVYAFLGIPYANPGKPNRRLHNAFTGMKWDGVYPTKKFGSRCIQMTDDETWTDPIVVGEDNCLFLNIFTPFLDEKKKLNVIFFIHGGGFMKGSANMYTPDFIMDRHDVVFVTINYRLGPLGFLSTEDDVIPGNVGLKDQVVALQWVRNNIDQFGGDKDKITLMGEDAGAASVHLHYLSPLSRNLFKQGISLGGTAFCPWALAKKPLLKAERLAEKMGCNGTDSKSILHCFQLYHYPLMIRYVRELFMPWKYLPFSPFGPVIEKNNSDAFLTDNPHKIIEEKKVKDAPWLVGLTSHEGLFPGAKFARNHDILEEIDENWQEIAPILLDYNHTVPRKMLHTVNEKIRQYYFEDKEISAARRQAFIRMLGDRFYFADTERAIRLQASVSSSYTFLYKFSYRGRHSRAYPLCKCSENMGASHGDDLLYLFDLPGYNVTETKYGVAMMRLMVNVLMSFVEMGIPKTEPDAVWKPVPREAVKGNNINYMDIVTSQTQSLESSPDIGNVRFWTNLHLAELKNIVGDHKKFFDEL